MEIPEEPTHEPEIDSPPEEPTGPSPMGPIVPPPEKNPETEGDDPMGPTIEQPTNDPEMPVPDPDSSS